MIKRKTATSFGFVIAAGVSVATAAPASAGGVGDFLSPAFGTSCANQNTGARATGTTHHGTGTAGGNLAGLPLGSALNHCGGADFKSIFGSTGSQATSAEESAQKLNEKIPGARPERKGVDPELYDGIPEVARDPKIVRETSPEALDILSNFITPLFKNSASK
ncbi:hypothetical protein [Streptomyces sp. NPDC000229]|uniref:hypothetical protein n=1 Tax=Streptomyces sp. NPDC000229 TaxID=3154247 RepID=UPI00331FEB1D